MGTLPQLILLGDCRFVPLKGPPVKIKGSRSELLVGIAALTEKRLNDAQLAKLLSDGSAQPPSEGSVRTLRHRLPAKVKDHLGSAANRWHFEGVEIDVIRLRKEALELRRAGVAADGRALRKALEKAAQPLLPGVPPEDEGDLWLTGRRKALQEMRADLLETAIAWADHHSDPWADDLRTTLREIDPGRVPPRPVVRRARSRSGAHGRTVRRFRVMSDGSGRLQRETTLSSTTGSDTS